MKKQKLPKWFKGETYKDGSEVTNPFSGETFTLTGAELSMYDFIIGSQLVFEMMPKNINPEQIKDFQAALDWFKKNNNEAYMVLLD